MKVDVFLSQNEFFHHSRRLHQSTGGKLIGEHFAKLMKTEADECSSTICRLRNKGKNQLQKMLRFLCWNLRRIVR